jgi:hypothetical protein
MKILLHITFNNKIFIGVFRKNIFVELESDRNQEKHIR